MRQPSARDVTIDALATFRLTRLIVEDTFPPIRKARAWIHERFPEFGNTVHVDDGWWFESRDRETWAHRDFTVHGRTFHSQVQVDTAGSVGEVAHAVVLEAHPLGELIGCPWCMGVWVGAGVVVLRALVPDLWDPMARLLAGAAVAGVIATH